jgi:L-ascorbate metabolism protein UlaG (beta-lactamase superfamily)
LENFLSRSSLEAYCQYLVEPTPEGAGEPGLTVRFLGVTTLLFSDGRTSLMTDGFFTRPGGILKIALGRKIKPDRDVIRRGLRKASVDQLSAVIPLHSHYDHAMDSPEVAQQTGATLLGSESSANIGRGWGLPEAQTEVVIPGKAYRFGDFTLTFIETTHVPLRVNVNRGGTEIEEPLVPPVPPLDYKVGQVYSLHIQHPLGKVLVHGSANFVPEALEGLSPEVVCLSIGGLAYLEREYKETLFNEVVTATGASRVIPLHYDDFTRPLGEPMRLMPRILDDVGVSLDFLVEKAEAQPELELQLLPAWEEVVMFEG